jgi:hypothetical protein
MIDLCEKARVERWDDEFVKIDFWGINIIPFIGLGITFG